MALRNRHSPARERRIRHLTFNDYLRNLRHVGLIDVPVSRLPRHANGRRPQIEAESVPSIKPDLSVENIDLNIQANSNDHHTNQYSLCENKQHLVIRRGQTFDVSIEFNSNFDPKCHDIRLLFLAGKTPSPTKGTRVSLILSDKDNANEWGAWIVTNDEKKLTVRINTPPTLYVGIWKFEVQLIQKSDDKNIIFEFKSDDKIFVLFNPWCKDDSVYHPDTNLLDEYILNDTGKIYVGSKKKIYGKKWNFGQFEESILECAMYLMDNNKLSWTARGDPVKVCRKLTVITNDNVLVGNWSGDYEGGKSPLHWVGSVAILKQYYQSKSSVCYGQCWVFSGVLTTLFRSPGIPARSVTNFASAHDCDGSVSIDSHWNSAGEPLEELNEDSVWNFHVWNDVWMSRPDLPHGYGGWQAVDATPQETSEGLYQCGPAPLEAIKHGELHLPFDLPFVFAEVNADRVNWKVDDNGELTKIGITTHSIGAHISTKLPRGKSTGQFKWFCFDREREDLTDSYKYKEGSQEERAAVIKANQNSTKKGLYDEGKPSDVDFELVEKETMPYGEHIEISLKMNNKSNEARTVIGCLSTNSMHYTGVPAAKVKTLPINQKVAAKSDAEIKLEVTFEEYYNLLVDQCHMKMSCMCTVQETQHTYVHQDAFRLIKPALTIKAPSNGTVGQKIKAVVSFTNPLPVALTGCQLTYEGPGLQDPVVTVQSIVPAKQTFSTTVEFMPKKIGKKELVMSFNSKELEMVDGECEITITQ